VKLIFDIFTTVKISDKFHTDTFNVAMK